MDEIDIESIIREREERNREEEEIYKKEREKAVFFNPGYDWYSLLNFTIT